ncbi:Uncharacterised protein [Serratia fonticola]|uniref:Uncharacterized protein n=1 Tax=Serratia fonticola TaxID=47917 RepID=A0A4U9VWF8_SERFO|nr:Uncharacterised protein [Serratia fonticola]
MGNTAYVPKGPFTASFNFITKIAMAIGGGCAGLMLDYFDYSSEHISANAAQRHQYDDDAVPGLMFALGCCLSSSTSWMSTPTEISSKTLNCAKLARSNPAGINMKKDFHAIIATMDCRRESGVTQR